MKTFHREQLTGHTAAILVEIPAMISDGLRCFLKLKIAGKWPISLHHVLILLHILEYLSVFLSDPLTVFSVGMIINFNMPSCEL